jgi:pyruvate dehydrogenase E1 component alpha subunit
MTPDDLIAFEKRVADAFNDAKIRAPVHLSGGNEVDLIELFDAADIGDDDWVLTTWRSHYHCLLKGVHPERLFADIVAGRSITLCYPDKKILSSAIVGGILPIGLGLAWSIKRAGTGRVFVFVGDMAARTGVFDECLRYAAGHDLPIQFTVEDNQLSVVSPTEKVWGEEYTEPLRRYERVDAYDYKLGWPHAGAGKRVNF